MILQARDVGELAVAQMQSSPEGRVTRVFKRSAYVETDQGLILLLQGDLRSPVTINLGTEADLESLVSVGGECCLGGETLRFSELTIERAGADVYRSALLNHSEVSVIEPRELVRGATTLDLLYGVSPPSLDIVGSEQFSSFVRRVARPLARGDTNATYRVGNYLPLIGLGSGFTPAGDDFVAGFIGTFNYVARSMGSKQVILPWNELAARTVPESARLLDYAQRGYCDEGLSRLVLSATTSDHGNFWNDLLEVARRGHTSGIDMSLGVILASASIAGALGSGDAMENVLDRLSRQRTL